MEIVKVRNYDEMSEKACDLIVEKVNKLDNPVLGLATGSTPEGMYQQMIDSYQKNKVSFTKTTTFNLDEYVGLAGNNPNSYRFYMNEKLFKHIDLPDNRAFLPTGDSDDLQKECRDYETLMYKAEYIDVQVLGLGLNGHIGFNEPGTAFDSRTHIVDLDETTRKANARFFDSLNDVPERAITMGIETIMESKKILLLVSGEKKAEAVYRLVYGETSEEFPASILQKHENVILIADEGALSKL
ncbi:glucosamine-6-phosphate deaminase [Virgibacillus subterraneus]|uniref:Glucosamine-6-phosphate deaminase n=1 Tax=Virgibacillus subterraneus TaxID=621109 RepID=A0A1H9BNC2_9BACI|nr:glucosamine-6-phosphate deaminase [Virgibacillus subterraneus]SEP90452.1 glucosamine-6-phosphate deaminase [Virgibacillus subterraneus]